MMLTRTQICLLIIVYSSLLVVGCDQIAARLRDTGVDKSASTRTDTQRDPSLNIKIDQANSGSESQLEDRGRTRSDEGIKLGSTDRSSSDHGGYSHNSLVNDVRTGDSVSETSVEILVRKNVSLFERIKSLSLEENSSE